MITKKKILRQLNQIAKLAKLSGAKGRLDLHYCGIHPDKWDRLLETITEFPRIRHIISIDGIQIYLLLD